MIMNSCRCKNVIGPGLIWLLMETFALVFVIGGNALAGGTAVSDADRPVMQTASLGAEVPGPRILPPRDDSDGGPSNALSAKRFNDQGIDYAKEGKYDLAIFEFTKDLAVEPLSAETYNNRGIAYSRKGLYDLAIADFTKAIDLAPGEPKTLYNRGITYAIHGHYNLAISDLTEAMKLQPADSSTYDIIGSVHMELACMNWKIACTLGNCDPLNKAARVGLCAKGSSSSQ